jgi:hypothetical protein
MPRNNNSTKNRTYTCKLSINVEAPNKRRAAEVLLKEIEDGWVQPEDVIVS